MPTVLGVAAFAVLHTLGWGWALESAVAPSPPDRGGRGWRAALQHHVTPRVATVAIGLALVGAAAVPNASVFRTRCGVFAAAGHGIVAWLAKPSGTSLV
jgi:hypothetical protein